MQMMDAQSVCVCHDLCRRLQIAHGGILNVRSALSRLQLMRYCSEAKIMYSISFPSYDTYYRITPIVLRIDASRDGSRTLA